MKNNTPVVDQASDPVPEFAANIIKTLREPLLLLDAKLRIRSASRAFYRVFAVSPEETLGRHIYELGDGQWGSPTLRKLLDEILPTDGSFDDYSVEHDFPGIGARTMLLNARGLQDGSSQPNLILLAIEDITDRQSAQREVARQKYWFETTLSSIGDAVIATDAAARVTFMNPTAESMTGWKSDEAAGKPLLDVFNIINEETRQLVESPVAKAIRMGAIVGLANHTILIARDGSEHAIDDSAAPIREDGKIVGVVMVFHDITERRAAEARIELSETRYRRLFETAHDGILILDASTARIVDVNPFMLQFLDYPREYFIGKELWEIGVFQDKDENLNAMRELQRKKQIRFEDKPLEDSSGRERPVEFVSNMYQEGRHSVIQCNIRDISERKASQEALRAGEERYRRLFEAVPVAVFACDKDGVIQDYNRRAQEYWGRSPERGNPRERYTGAFKLCHPDGTAMPSNESPILDVLRDGTPREDVELIIERPDRTRLPVNARFFPLTNEKGAILGAIACLSDVTTMKRFERERDALLANEQAARMEAQAANRSKDLFLATLSHEVRTPLNAILGWATILRAPTRTAEDMDEGMEVIERNCKAQAQLIEDVLDISRVVSGKFQLNVNACDLAATVRAAVATIRPSALAKNIQILTDIDASAADVACDEGRMQQVIWNLLANSIKFTPKGGTVRVSLSRESSRTRIAVSDTGNGISADLLPYVFDRFRQADSTSRRKLGGLGLGLSIVKYIVESHGGIVEAKSDGEGHGSAFIVSLPVRAVQADAADPVTPGARGAILLTIDGVSKLLRLDDVRVLVVDDEADARRLLKKVLQDAGADVTLAAGAAEAIRLLSRQDRNAMVKPHILLSDLGMPDMDGFDLIRSVRQLYNPMELPAIAVTAFAHRDDERRALLAGFQLHVTKPVDPHDLVGIIASLTARV